MYTFTVPQEPGYPAYVLAGDEVLHMTIHHYEIHRHTGVWAVLIDSPVATRRTIKVNVRGFNKQVFLTRDAAEAALNNRR